MKIRTTLRVLSAVSVLTMVGLIVSSALAYARLRGAGAFEVFLLDLQRNQVERVMVRDDFLLREQASAFLQWQQKSEEVEGHLKALSKMPMNSDRRALVARMARNFEATQALLPRLVDVRASANLQVLERRLVNQLIVNAYLLSDSVSLLLHEARNDTIQARDRLVLLLGLFTALLASTVTVTAIYLNRLLSRGITSLKTGTDIIIEGRFGYRIPIVGEDELAELATRFNDMSDRLKHSYESLEAANRELEGFSYSVSHDLRTPLRHVLSFSELLLRKDPEGLDEQSRHYLDVICKSTTQMGRLIDDLLAYSRMGSVDMRKSAVPLGEVVATVVQELTSAAAGRSIQWVIPALPTVSGDESMLRLVLGNLLANAVKFTSKRPDAVIEVGCREEANEIVLFVRDNGAGFDMQFADKLFRLFRRLHRANEFEGTGVGLANVRRIISRHGGRTWAEGKVDAGATLYFSLPVIPEDHHA
jgi:signal transduction histidine kinase